MALPRAARSALTAAVLVACPASTTAQSGLLRVTCFATMDVRAPRIEGELWVPVDALQAVQPIDKDGDMAFSHAEMTFAQTVLSRYVRFNLLFFWQGRNHSPTVLDVETARRGRDRQDYFRARFRVNDYPPNEPVVIYSQLLREIPADPRCVALINLPGRREVFVFSLADCYQYPPPAEPGRGVPTYRPPEERGRIALVEPWGMNIEIAYVLPEGAFHLYALAEDRYTPLALPAKPLLATARDGDRATALTFAPEPLVGERPDRPSHFAAPAPSLTDASAFVVEIKIERDHGQVQMMIPDVPAIRPAKPEERAAARRRYACPNLCLGVQSKKGHARCMRCREPLIEARGADVPGAGQIGPHGGPAVALGDRPLHVEALLTATDEVRLYLLDAEMAVVPLARTTATAFFHDVRAYQEEVERPAKPADGGKWLTIRPPDKIERPFGMRCHIDVHDGKPPAQVHFQFSEITPIEGKDG